MKKYFEVLLIPIKMILVLVIALGLFEGMRNIFINDDTYFENYNTSFKSLKEDSLDILVLGSSHAQYSFVPGFLYSETGLYSYILGSACQPYEVSVNMLKEALKTQAVKMVIMEVYTGLPHSVMCEGNVAYVHAQYHMSGEEKYNTIDYLEDDALNYYNDFINNHNNWINYDLDDYKQKLNYGLSEISLTLGYVAQFPTEYSNMWHATYYPELMDIAELDKRDEDSLNEILNICRANGIELLLYKTPIDGIDEENQSYLNAIWKWADDNGVSYLDFFRLQEELDFMMQRDADSFHLNILGASLITHRISEYINEHIDIFNHEVDDSLELIYKTSNEEYSTNLLVYEDNPSKYLYRYSTLDDLSIIYYDGSYIDNNIKEEFRNIGIDLDSGHYFIIEDGEVIYSSLNSLDVYYEDNHILINSDGLFIDEIEVEVSSLSIALLNDDFSVSILKNIE